jgi:hypothetical protein
LHRALSAATLLATTLSAATLLATTATLRRTLRTALHCALSAAAGVHSALPATVHPTLPTAPLFSGVTRGLFETRRRLPRKISALYTGGIPPGVERSAAFLHKCS